MFHATSLKLTIWYVAIMMLLSLVFSLALFQSQHNTLAGGLDRQTTRFRGTLGPNGTFPSNTDEIRNTILNDSDRKSIHYLVLINLGVLVVASVGGYALAKRTLRPIQLMVEEQARFTSDASHELRTPLTAMRTEIEVALRDKQLDLIGAKELLGSNLEEVEKLSTLSQRLLDLAKYDQINPQTIELLPVGELIGRAWHRVKPMAEAKKITASFDLSDEPVVGQADALAELFVILLDNGIKYNQSGGKLTVLARKTGPLVTIAITDTGLGIKGVDLPHIFDRFFRADTSRTKTITDGHGLGLSIAKQIVLQHRGSITVDSIIGQGTTFTIKLPSPQVKQISE